MLAAAIARLVGGEGAGWIAEGKRDARPRRPTRGSRRSPRSPARSRRASLVLELGVYPLVAKLRPFTALGGAAQDAVLEDLADSSLGLKRTLWRGLRTIAFLTFYADPAVRPLIHYPGPFGRGAVTIADAMRWTPPR